MYFNVILYPFRQFLSVTIFLHLNVQCEIMPFGGVHVQMKYQLGSVLVVV